MLVNFNSSTKNFSTEANKRKRLTYKTKNCEQSHQWEERGEETIDERR